MSDATPQRRVQLGILELDWPTEDPIHPALPYPPPSQARGEAAAAHGLATAGVLLSRAADVPGICPEAAVVLACPGSDEALADALERLASRLTDGSVLLVEATVRTEGPDLPIEYDPDVRRVIEAHVGRLVIIEPAGNSGFDLDSLQAEPTAAWRVGACDDDGAWLGTSNHGQQVQFHALGSGIPSLGWGARRIEYRDTSAAAAQVAGIALSAQQTASSRIGRPLRPDALLAQLQRTGSAQARSALDPSIGIQPDLHSFLRSIKDYRALSPRWEAPASPPLG